MADVRPMIPPHAHCVARPPLQVVAFDLDDTLYLERDYVLSGFRHIANLVAASAQRKPSEIFRFLRLTAYEWQCHGNNLDLLLAHYPQIARQWTVDMLVREYRSHVPHLRFLRGIESLLDEIRAAGAHLAVITDGPADSQHRKLDALRLNGKIDKTVVTEDYGPAYRKPRPLSFGMVMTHFGCTPESCLYVGDNPAKDFLAPRALGWHTVRLRFRGQLHETAEAMSPEASPHRECSTVGAFRTYLMTRLNFDHQAERIPGVSTHEQPA